LVLGAFVVGTTAPALAQGTQTQTAPTPATSTAPAAKPAAPAASTTPAAKPEPKKAATLKPVAGTVKTVSADSLVVVASGKDKKEWTFVLDKDTKVTKADKPADAKALAEKDAVTVRYKEADGKMIATSVNVKTPKKSS
jgi:hypothetical protein